MSGAGAGAPAVAVLGAGGVGALVAAALAATGTRVTVVARAPGAAVLRRDGLRVSSVTLGQLRARPLVAEQLEQPVEVLIVATKAGGLERALERVRADPELVVPLLNGLDHLAVLRARFGARVAAGSIRVEARRTAPGVVVHYSSFLRVELSAEHVEAAAAGLVPRLADALGAAGITATVSEREAAVMWGKLCRLCALALTTAASGLTLGELRQDPLRLGQLEACVREVAAVAVAEGAAVDPGAVLAELGEGHPGLVSSLARDVAARRETELDAIAGAVLRAGARHGLGCPTVTVLCDEVRGLLA